MRRTPILDDIIGFLDEREQLPPDDRFPLRPAFTLERLYRTQSARLSSFFSRRVDKQDVEDLVHEVFARLAKIGRARVPEIEQPEAYLSVVATNILRDRARTAARRALDRHEAINPENLRTEDPHHRLEQRDVIARIDNALLTLSPRRRQIFLLHRLDHLTYAEIGDVVGMSEKGVKKQMAKALYQLRCALGDI